MLYRSSLAKKIVSIGFIFCVVGSLGALGFRVFLNMRVAQHLFSQEDLPPAQAVIVLGAKVYSDGRLSLAVQQRADAAFLLRKSGKAKKILVSGDNRTKWYDEVTTIKNYLLKRGVPDSAIFLDYAGLDTYDSMYRAQYIFQVSSLLIPTQNFHIVRSVYIARALGIEASGRGLDDKVLPNRQQLAVREIFAQWKAGFDVLFGVLPHHLGEIVPITGKSNSE